jgi:phosphate transport system substrate-binding protein
VSTGGLHSTLRPPRPPRSRRILARLTAAIIVLIGVVTGGNWLRGGTAFADTVINGEGSNFTLTAMQQWLVHFPNVNYQGIGSPNGLNQFFPPQGPQAAQPIHFVETDIPYTPGQLTTHSDYPLGPASSGGTWSYVPVAAGGISFMYHLHDANNQPVGTLRLNQIAIADIMTFKITQWNDPYLADLNPGIALPNEKIHLVVDSTPSGQTYLLTQYFLSNPAAAAVYKAYTGDNAPQPNWGPLESSPSGPVIGPCSPQCIAEAGPSAQAEEVSQPNNEGFIAYVPTAYAVSDHEPVAAVQNFAGKYTLPSHDDVTAALDSATNPNGSGVFDGYEQIDWNAPAPNAYAISTYSYMLVWLAPSKVPGLTQAAADAVASFGQWAITIGQENAYAIGYAPISNVLIKFGLQTFESIPGSPQNVSIPCIPGSEGNTCHQDPAGPCLGGGQTAGSPGSCGTTTTAPPPAPLPPAPGVGTHSGSTGTGTGSQSAGVAGQGAGPSTPSASGGSSAGASSTSPRSSGRAGSPGMHQVAVGASGSASTGGTGSARRGNGADGLQATSAALPSQLTVVHEDDTPHHGSSGLTGVLTGLVLGPDAITAASGVMALSLLLLWFAIRKTRRAGWR